MRDKRDEFMQMMVTNIAENTIQTITKKTTHIQALIRDSPFGIKPHAP
jgi:hypothetical protein